MRPQKVIGWKSVGHFKDMFSNLILVLLLDEVSVAILEHAKKCGYGMLQEYLILWMLNDGLQQQWVSR